MSQLALDIVPKYVYAKSNFVSHSGVKALEKAVELAAQRKDFASFFIFGPARSGKTHVSVALSEMLTAFSLLPRLIDAAASEEVVLDELAESGAAAVLIDNAQHFFSRPGFSSGKFVNLYESLRRNKGILLLISSTAAGEFAVDDHVRSRLVSSVGLEIEAPQEDELPLLIERMGEQRGLRLSAQKIQFLAPRLPRRVSAIEEYIDRLMYLCRVVGKRPDFQMLSGALEPA